MNYKDIAITLCDGFLDMTCGCEACPLFNEDSLDDNGNMVCDLEKLRSEDEYNSFTEWLAEHDKEVIQNYIDKVVEEFIKSSKETVDGLDIIEMQKAIDILKGGW